MRTQTVSAGTSSSIPAAVNTLLRSLALAALSFVLASCASIHAQRTQYVGAPHYPHTDPGKVEILRSTPARPHERLGEIALDASTDPAPPVSDVEARLRNEAAKMGADAVVVVYDRIQPTAVVVTGGYWNRSVETITGRKLIAVAIKYK